MKRILLSTLCALVMIVVCCLAFLPTSAASVGEEIIDDYFATGYYNWSVSTWFKIPVDVYNYNIFDVWGGGGTDIPNDMVVQGNDLYIHVSTSKNTSRVAHLNNYEIRIVGDEYQIIDIDAGYPVLSYILETDSIQLLRYTDIDSVYMNVPVDSRFTFYSRINPDDTNRFLTADVGRVVFGQFGLVRVFDTYTAYINGRTAGFDDGDNFGFNRGHEIGYEEGYTTGQSLTYQDGYNDATRHISSGQFGVNLIGNTFRASIEGISNLRLVALPNGQWITLGGIFFGVIGILLVLIFLKMFAGG